ncbi:probable leucine--tRNA ligase, mitochondrial [Trichonephila inaurata madagascariensis]|uniref:leucine--tRNA ligase n=1 Tax=Trichonephila inaurata madagascariensis TaxID=2747483 RepID=A0A8X7CFW6_9ARAC|nr:probable leucine--tRNA ligase, mitochondrial [Trichonephila inaurata madagascariensis]
MGRILHLPYLFKIHHLRNLSHLNFTRLIFSCSGVLEEELTNDVKKNIELHWRNKVNDYPVQKDAQKYYLLSMFPYPSGNLHMGHVRVYTISDAMTRFFRMNGKKVIHPIGWDAFGLPAENAAIERNIHPSDWTLNNIQTMKKQLQDFNINFDWDRELATCDASYYKWTQYLFLLMFEQGLAYKKEALLNWDPIDQTVLADEQVDENGCSWRSGCKVEKRRLSQWFLRTSEFSKDLYEGLNDPNLVEWRDVTKIQQHWIGEPDGFIFHLDVQYNNEILPKALTVWTNTPELIYGATFIGISPDNNFNSPQYGSSSKTDDHCLNIKVKHPFTGKNLPVFVSSNLDHSPATDSCLGIPASENIKFADFASKHNIDTIQVLDDTTNFLINSAEFSGKDRTVARKEIIERAKDNGIKVYQASKRLRDWLISRQRYWGTPIPIINCPTCKSVPVNKEDLPVLLPCVSDFAGKGSTLKNVDSWIKTSCPKYVSHNYAHTRQLSVVISKLQGLTGQLRRIPKAMAQTEAYEKALSDLLVMLAPLAPHFTSELWTAFSSAAVGRNSTYDLTKPVFHQTWPRIPADCPMEIVIKINGDEIDSIPIAKNDLEQLSAEKAIDIALSRQKVLDILQGAKIKHTHYKASKDHDSEINIIYKPLGKKGKKFNKKSKAADVAA